MAKKLKQLLCAMLAFVMCFGAVMPVFAIEAGDNAAGKIRFPIDKTANGLNADDMTDVTLTVPGTVEGYIDVVFVLGGGMTANIKTIESAIEVFRPVMENGKATVRMGLISLEKGQEIILDLNSDEAVLDPTTYIEFVTEKFNSINSLPGGTTNLHSQLLEAQRMLAAETKAKAENKYIFVLATGRTYWFDDANGNQAFILSEATNNKSFAWGNYVWQCQRAVGTSYYQIPAKYNNNYEAFFADIESWVIEDGDKYVYAPGFDPSDVYAYSNWYTNNSGTNCPANGISGGRMGTLIRNPAPDPEKYDGVVYTASSKGGPAHALNYERAQYECVQVWKDLIANGYNCYSICSEAYKYQSYSSYIKGAASQLQVGHAFMDYLAKLAGQSGDKAPVVWEDNGTQQGKLNENFFESVRNDMLYTCAEKSTVVDYIGKNENGNFEFIENADYIKLNVGGDDYVTTQVETKEGANSSYAFTKHSDDCGDDCDCDPTFWLDYVYGDGETTEHFVWTFGEKLSLERLAHLTYKLLLKDKQDEEGTYTVPTNNSAVLYPIDSDGNAGAPQVFPVPEVEYTVIKGTDVVIKKVDENGKPLTGASFELFDAAGNSFGVKTVNREGELTFVGLKAGSYTLVETKAPAGYVGLSKPVSFEVVYVKDHFEVNMVDEFVLHFPATAYEISNHSFYPAIPQTFVLLNSANAADWEYSGEYAFGQSDFEVVYCADSTVDAENSSVYLNYALEDVFPEQAGNLRAIIANSYPYVSMGDMIAAATAAGVADAANLTRGDIIAAVQLAIWKYTNNADHTYRGTYSVMNYPQWGKVFHDYTNELPDYLPKNTTSTIKDTAGAARVEALYDYLVNLAPLRAEESAINAVCYIAKDGKGASQSLIGGIFNDTTITVKNHSQYDIDIVLALGAGIAQYDADSAKGSNTYDSIITLVEDFVNAGHSVKLGLVAVEHYDDVAMPLTVLTKDNYKQVITDGLNKIQSMPAGPTNLHSNIVAAKDMLDADTSVPAENKFFYVIATGRTYNFDNASGVPTTIINKIALKGTTYYYWGHYLWQSQRGGHTSLYMIPASYGNNWDAYWADVCKWVEADGDKFAFSFTDYYNVNDPQWFNTFYGANSTDAKALGLASSRFGWILKDLTGKSLDAIGSGSNPQNALNYERAQYEAWKAYTAMQAAGYTCQALCSESTSYQNGSPYIKIAKYTGTSTMQLGHSFMNFLNGGESPLLFVMTDPNTGASEMAKDFFAPIDMEKLVKSEKAPAPSVDEEVENTPVQSAPDTDKGPVMMAPAPKKPIVITSQPEDVKAAIGEKFAITVVAEGEGLSYQWFYKNKSGKEFAPSSFKSKSYAMTMAEYCHERQVYCVITDANGNMLVTDTVTITRPTLDLEIISQPQSVTAEIGEKVTITVKVKGDDLSYQWYYRNKGSAEFAASSYKGKTYAIAMAEYCHMREVYCVITDGNGNTVTTDTVMMSRPVKTVELLSQPTDVTAKAGTTARVTVNATGDGLVYQWFYKNKNGKSFAVSSMKGKTYAVSMASYCDMRQVYCVITDAYGNTVTTDVVTLRIG